MCQPDAFYLRVGAEQRKKADVHGRAAA